jgi:hypothetical protein
MSNCIQSSISYRYNKQTENQFSGTLFCIRKSVMWSVWIKRWARNKSQKMRIDRLLYARSPPEINVALCTYIFVDCFLFFLTLCMWLSLWRNKVLYIIILAPPMAALQRTACKLVSSELVITWITYRYQEVIILINRIGSIVLLMRRALKMPLTL